MTPELLARLRTPAGAQALAAAWAVRDRDPLTAAANLRAAAVPADLAAAALTQTALRLRAQAKFGPDAHTMFFTRAGLEQATRATVATRRAQRLVAGGATTLADLCAGVGADTIAAARHGLRVLAVEADALTAAVVAANVDVLGLNSLASVEHADARETDLRRFDAVFCDPARRSGGTRIFDPRGYSPPWSFVSGLGDAVPRTVLKLAPGLDHALIPAGVEAEWVSVGGDLVEATLWYGPLAQVPRRASVIGTDASVTQLTGTGTEQAPTGPVRGYLYDPDDAVVRAHLVAEFAATVDGTLADPRIAYVYADKPVATPLGRCLAIVEALPFSVKRLRAALRTHAAGPVTVMKRGSAVDTESLRKDLRTTGDIAMTVVLTRVADAPTALICMEQRS